MITPKQPSTAARVAYLVAAYLLAALGTAFWMSTHAPPPTTNESRSWIGLLGFALFFPSGLWNLSGATIPGELPYLVYAVLGLATVVVRSSRAFYTLFATFLVLIIVNIGGCLKAPF